MSRGNAECTMRNDEKAIIADRFRPVVYHFVEIKS